MLLFVFAQQKLYISWNLLVIDRPEAAINMLKWIFTKHWQIILTSLAFIEYWQCHGPMVVKILSVKNEVKFIILLGLLGKFYLNFGVSNS